MKDLKRKAVTLDHLRRMDDGPPLSPRDVSRLVGGSITPDKIRDDIIAENLYAAVIKSSGGKRHRYLIPFLEVRRYLQGFLRVVA
jgi:hypothetical protein